MVGHQENQAKGDSDAQTTAFKRIDSGNLDG